MKNMIIHQLALTSLIEIWADGSVFYMIVRYTEYTKRIPPPCLIFYKGSMSHQKMKMECQIVMVLTSLIEIWANESVFLLIVHYIE